MVSLRARLASGARFVALMLIGFTCVHDGQATTARDYVSEWLDQQGAIRTWSASFVQTRSLKTLKQPLKTEGRVWFATPDRFRWELGVPAQTIAVRETNAVVVHYPRLRRGERYPVDAGAGGPWSQMLTLLEAGFPRSRKDLDERFTVVSEVVTNGVVEVNLRPRVASVRRILPKFRVVLSAENATLQATELAFPDGSTMRNDFSDVQINPVLDDGLFRIVFEPDEKVSEPLSTGR